jgi:hypothetical protein
MYSRDTLREEMRRRYEHTLMRYGFGLGVIFTVVVQFLLSLVL